MFGFNYCVNIIGLSYATCAPTRVPPHHLQRQCTSKLQVPWLCCTLWTPERMRSRLLNDYTGVRCRPCARLLKHIRRTPAVSQSVRTGRCLARVRQSRLLHKIWFDLLSDWRENARPCTYDASMLGRYQCICGTYQSHYACGGAGYPYTATRHNCFSRRRSLYAC